MRANSRSRRRFLGLSAGAAATSLLAGCAGGIGSDDDPQAQPLEPADWEGLDEFVVDGYTGNWIGVEPDVIEGIRNPTLLLFEGEEYELTWNNADGGAHNIAIWDEADAVVDGHQTRIIRGRDETQTLSFEATTEMHQYVCEPHKRSMIGYFRIVSE
ncbi:plastocyanin/azurin family copper-binding protein [Halovivax sp.]|uniref:plastocyanin/azurin family copper-binding protein n=1 Tax=Halovivax sp. TaxID=1935978 RepID=UPI0025C40891|nr:plastocyanin/azurin family copper-binding protein [Halovivax sp.]